MTTFSDSLNDRDYRAAWGLDEQPEPSASRNKIPAFFNLEDHDDEDEVKKWFETAVPILQDQAIEFTRKSVENLMFYKGVQLEQHRHYYNFEDAHRYLRDNKVSFNIIYEFVELWVNRVAAFKPNVGATPKTDDAEARENAEAKELALKDYFHKNKVNRLLNEFDRHCFTFGESYLHVSWDQDRGPLHPAFEEIEDKYRGLKRVGTPSGDDVNVDRLPRIGDVKVDIVPAIFVYFEDRNWEDLDYVILDLKMNIDKLRSDYPNVEIRGEGDISCYVLYHLPTKYLPKGRYVKYAAGEILENTGFPYDKPLMPVIRMSNIDVVGAGRAKSFIENIKAHQVLINETISNTWNNLRRSAKGKWVAPAKTVNPRHFAPSSPAIEYYGSIPPQFITYPGIKPEAIQFIELMREYAEKQARIQGVVQGTPPPNVRSGLQFAQLEEQEKRSVEITIEKKNAAIEQLSEMIALVMAKFYREEDGRTMTIFGKDKEYLTKALKLDAIKEDHAVKVENNDALPTGRASQFAFFYDILEKFGKQVVPDEMMIDMLDSGRFNQYTEFGGATIETTMAQISTMERGERPEPPGGHEDLILKWKIVVGTMRKRKFLSYEKAVKDVFEKFVYAIEDLIINKENKTPAMEERLQTLQSFPIYYKPQITQFDEQLPVSPIPADISSAEAEVPLNGAEEIPAELLAEAAGPPV